MHTAGDGRVSVSGGWWWLDYLEVNPEAGSSWEEVRRRLDRQQGYAASLQVRTVYPAISDPEAESHGMLRIVDESEEDYLFPARLFVPIEVPDAAVKVFAGAA